MRALCAKDLPGTLAAVAAIGYNEVEAFTLYRNPPAEFRQIVSDHGMALPSVHVREKIDADWSPHVEAAKALGVQYVVALLAPPDHGVLGRDDYLRAAERYNRIAEPFRGAGIQFCYHNHGFEFAPLGDTSGFDLLLRDTDPKLVKIELDCFWAARAGRSPVEILRADPRRFPLLHIKDIKPGVAPSTRPGATEGMTEVGSGVIDWRAIFAAAQPAHIFVEQDVTSLPVLDSIKVSYEYVRRLRT